MAYALRVKKSATLPSRLSRKRGNDGLTDTQRNARAARWRNGAGAAPSPADTERLRQFALSQLATRQAG